MQSIDVQINSDIVWTRGTRDDLLFIYFEPWFRTSCSWFPAAIWSYQPLDTSVKAFAAPHTLLTTRPESVTCSTPTQKRKQPSVHVETLSHCFDHIDIRKPAHYRACWHCVTGARQGFDRSPTKLIRAPCQGFQVHSMQTLANLSWIRKQFRTVPSPFGGRPLTSPSTCEERRSCSAPRVLAQSTECPGPP